MAITVCTVLILSGCGGKPKAVPTEAVAETTAGVPVTEAETAIETYTESEEAGPAAAPVPEAVQESILDPVEAFAEQIQEAVADKDMEALGGLLTYPCSIQTVDKENVVITERSAFLKQNPDLVFGDDLMTAIANVDTAGLTESGAGYVMGDGMPNVIFQKLSDGSFGITGINE